MAHGGTNLGYSLKGTRSFHFNISRSQLQPKGRTNTSQNSPTVCLCCTKKDDQKVIGSPFKGDMGRDIRCIGLIIKGPPSQGFSHHFHPFSLSIRVSWPVSTFYWLKKKRVYTWRIIPFSEWFIPMVNKSPKDRVVGPLPNGLSMDYKLGDPNHLQVLGAHPPSMG